MTRKLANLGGHASALLSIGARGAGSVLQLLATILIGNSAGAAAVALYITMLTWYRLAEIVLNLGVAPQALRDGSRLSENTSAFWFLARVSKATTPLALAVTVAGIGWGLGVWALGAGEVAAVGVCGAVGGVSMAKSKLAIELLKARGRGIIALLFEFSVVPALTIALVAGAPGVWSGATGLTWIVAFAVAAVLSMVSSHLTLWALERGRNHGREVRYSGLSSESKRFLSAGALGIALWVTPTLLVPIMVSGEDAGRFAVCFRLAAVAELILGGLAAVFAPRFARYWGEGDTRHLAKSFALSRAVAAAVFVPFVLVVAVFGTEVLSVFGDEFASARPVLLIAVCGHLVNALTGLASELLLMTGAEREELATSAIAWAYMLVALVPATVVFGIGGAAFVYASSLSIRTLLAYSRATRKMRARVIPVPGGRTSRPASDANVTEAFR
ncbi:MAG: lipopolysaccharide biosynthesis protein [Acidimicrobiales bacterium]